MTELPECVERWTFPISRKQRFEDSLNGIRTRPAEVAFVREADLPTIIAQEREKWEAEVPGRADIEARLKRLTDTANDQAARADAAEADRDQAIESRNQANEAALAKQIELNQIREREPERRVEKVEYREIEHPRRWYQLRPRTEYRRRVRVRFEIPVPGQ